MYQTEEDRAIIRKLIQHYITDKRTIILLVSLLSGKKCYLTFLQSGHGRPKQPCQPRSVSLISFKLSGLRLIRPRFSMARAADPAGKRTVGIITKCDTLQSGDEQGVSGADYEKIRNVANIGKVLRIAKNEVERLTHGWFAVKNRSTQEIADGVTIEERHKSEKHFFSTTTPWTELKKDRTGIYALKAFLGGLLYNHIINEFPEVVKDTEQLLASTLKELELLGPSRQTNTDQRRFLMRLANAYQNEVSNALSGNYGLELQGNHPIKLRMHVRRLNDEFAECMARSGHAKLFQTAEGDIDKEFAHSGGDREDILDWIRDLYRESRGAELPGIVNPRVLENMFRQQSGLWQDIATTYIDEISTAVRKFNDAVFEGRISDDDLRHKLTTKLSRGHKMTHESASEQLLTILNDERGGILQTVNHYFADTLSAIREERVVARLKAQGFEDDDLVDIARMVEGVHLSNEDQAVNDIHDTLKAYYKVALKRFTDNVVLQITERLLLGPDGPVKILSPEMIGDLQDGELSDLAGESFSTSSTRNEVMSKFARLQKAVDVAKQALV
jgi:hypothetical protein